MRRDMAQHSRARQTPRSVRRRGAAVLVLIAVFAAVNLVPGLKGGISAAAADVTATALNLDTTAVTDRATDIANQRLRAADADTQSAQQGERELRNHLPIAAPRLIIGRAIAASSRNQGSTRTVQLNIGSADGVQRDRAVVSAQGLLGRISDVSAHSSVMTLLNDASSTVAARGQKSSALGALSGQNPSGLRLRSTPRLTFTVGAGSGLRTGETLVTAGSPNNTPYPPGLRIGKVISIDADRGQPERTATVAPFAAMAAVDVVGVVVE